MEDSKNKSLNSQHQEVIKEVNLMLQFFMKNERFSKVF